MGVSQWLLNPQQKVIFGASRIGLIVGLISATVSSTAIAADDVQATHHKQEQSELASTSGSDSGQVDTSLSLELNGHQHRAEVSEEHPSNSPDLTHQSYRFGVPGFDYTFSDQTPSDEIFSSVSVLFSQDNDVDPEQVEVTVKPLGLLESTSTSTGEQTNNDNAEQVETVEIEPSIVPDRIVSSEPESTEIKPGTGQIEAEQSSPTVSTDVGAVEPEVSYPIPVETEADPVEPSEPTIIIPPVPRQTVPTNTGVVAHQEPRIEREPISPGSGYIQLSNGVFVPREFAQVDSLISQHQAIAQVIGTPSQNRLLAIEQMQSFRGQSHGREINTHAPLSSFAQQYSTALISDTAIVNGAVYNQDQFPVYPLLTHGQLSSEFGWREQFGRHHDGYDIAVPIGTLVRASFSGRVKFADVNGNYGRLIQIEHNGNLETRYAHLSRIFVRPGQYVAQGTIIGATGNTGNTTGPHLHYEIRQNGAALNINDIVPEQRNFFLASVQRIRSNPLQNSTYTTYTISPSIPSGRSPSYRTEGPQNPSRDRRIRVALAVDQREIWLATSTVGHIVDGNGHVLKSIPARQNIRITQGENGELYADGELLPSAFFIQASNNGYVAVNNDWYRGKVFTASRTTGLLAVNWIGMELYIASVVGGEMSSSWDMDALMAQAIAARSYALVHMIRPHVRNWYDLTSTTRHQSYQGIRTEDQRTRQASSRTEGTILTSNVQSIHHVRGVVEALYGANMHVINNSHNGYGMPQIEANNLAQNGLSYMQILSRYYPSSQLSRMN